MEKEHHLKILSKYFDAVWDGSKPFEIRKNDRDYQVGQRLLLEEFDLSRDMWGSRKLVATISYVLDLGWCGATGYVALGLKDVKQ